MQPINCRTPKFVKQFSVKQRRIGKTAGPGIFRLRLNLFGKGCAQVGAGIQRSEHGAEPHPTNRRMTNRATDKDVVRRELLPNSVTARVRKIDAGRFTHFPAEPHGFF